MSTALEYSYPMNSNHSRNPKPLIKFKHSQLKNSLEIIEIESFFPKANSSEAILNESDIMVFDFSDDEDLCIV